MANSIQAEQTTVWRVEVEATTWSHGFQHRYLDKYAAVSAYCRERVLRHCAARGNWDRGYFMAAEDTLLSYIAEDYQRIDDLIGGYAYNLYGLSYRQEIPRFTDDLMCVFDLYDRFHCWVSSMMRENNG